MKTSRITRCALFASMALIMHILEGYIPPLTSIPGIKIGFANIITLAAVYILGNRDAFWILMVRIILGSFFAGQMMSFIYSLAGGLLCYAVTVLLKRFFTQNTIWVLGIIGALCHNTGQLVCAYFIFDTVSIFYYGLVLYAVSFVSGSFTGVCAQQMIKYFKAMKKE